MNNILIIGCGLIGSSILKASIAKKVSKNIFVYEKSKKNISVIKKINSKLKILDKLDERISDVDLVILCTPMSEYERIIPYLNKFLDKKSIITDVGYTKQNVLRLKNKKLNRSLDWILSHPISGSEVSGPKFGNKNLFKKKWCIIIDDKNKKKVKKVVRFWKKLGSKVIFMDPIEHDKIFAITSHLPHLIAYNLIKTAQDFQKKRKKILLNSVQVVSGIFLGPQHPMKLCGEMFSLIIKEI